ncbi:hypothetical protein [Tersicoccus sp. Bi-70]|uniref:hypothetical protein n=1 Tax=Tersicoccus sp. Bi-70 TaxID=1897634 RepID=UPI000978D1E9|nr:hypothetical protein [Tersicoccus sp. Bi-70]OMH30666.1 hypothetical protein BGP79_11955 [Tersicoccus sp. Bi-70]
MANSIDPAVATGADPAETSPKVKVTAYIGYALTLLAALAAAVVTVSPDVLDQLKAPVWLLPAALFVQTALGRFAGYQTPDPAREQHTTAVPASTMTITNASTGETTTVPFPSTDPTGSASAVGSTAVATAPGGVDPDDTAAVLGSITTPE